MAQVCEKKRVAGGP